MPFTELTPVTIHTHGTAPGASSTVSYHPPVGPPSNYAAYDLITGLGSDQFGDAVLGTAVLSGGNEVVISASIANNLNYNGISTYPGYPAVYETIIDNGVAATQPLALPSTFLNAPTGEDLLRVVPLTGGDFVVAEEAREEQVGTKTDPNLYFELFDSSGNEIGSVTTVNASGSTHAIGINDTFNLVPTSSNGFVIEWDEGNDFTGHFETFNVSGTTDANTTVTGQGSVQFHDGTNDGTDGLTGNVAVATNGNVIVATNPIGEGDFASANFAIYTASGTTVLGPESFATAEGSLLPNELSTITGDTGNPLENSFIQPQFLALPTGGFLAVIANPTGPYVLNTGFPGFNMYLQTISATGVFGKPELVETTTNGSADNFLDPLVLSNGDVVIDLGGHYDVDSVFNPGTFEVIDPSKVPANISTLVAMTPLFPNAVAPTVGTVSPSGADSPIQVAIPNGPGANTDNSFRFGVASTYFSADNNGGVFAALQSGIFTGFFGYGTLDANLYAANFDPVAPPVVSAAHIAVSGATGTGGDYKIGDTVTAAWNDSAAGDSNSATITGVTFDFSQFGGGTAVAATNVANVWTATYTITAGSIDAANRNVAVTASDSGGPTTTAGTNNVTVDDEQPVVTAAHISASGGTGTGGDFKIGDTVTAKWNDSATGDDNTDTVNAGGVTVNFSQFGGGSALTATNSGGMWTASYTITSGSIDTTTAHAVVTVTDHAGNTTTTASGAHAADNEQPVVTAPNISVSGGTGAGGAFRIGDTVTAIWNDSGTGDDNTDTINAGGVTFNFGQFGGGTAFVATDVSNIWTATYTVTAGNIDTTTAHVAVTATDHAGNATTTSGGAVSVDNEQPIVTAGATATFYGGGPAVTLDPGLALTDGVDIASATVTIGNFLTGDTLNFTMQNNISEQSYTGGVLTLTGSDTAADYQTALREVTYSFSGDPTDAGADTTRTITWSVSDTNGQTSVGGSTSTLDVFAQPIVVVGVAGTPQETSTGGPVIADSTLSITDYNGTTIHDASVQITGGDVPSDTLTINGTTSGSINDGVSGTISYSFTGTTLTLTGTDTVADYTTALDEVKFDAVSPNSGTRSLSWQVNDEAGGNTNDSVPVTTNVDVAFGPELTGGQNFGETEGTSTGPLQLVTFTDSEIASPTTANFTATINWGDGTALDTGTIADPNGGVFAVDSAGHTYAQGQAAPYQITVTVTDNPNSVMGTATDNAQVADAPLTPGTVALSPGGVEGVTPTTLSAAFTDANLGAPTSDFSGTINWGDGTGLTTFDSAAVTSNGGGSFTVNDGHQYTEEGTYTTTVTINDDGGSLNGDSSTTESSTTTIADAPLTAGTVTLSAGAVEGVTPTTLSATFNDANTGAPNTDFSGTIDWGDGTLTQFMSSAVTAGGGGNFTVGGSHQYLEEGTYTTTVTINDDGGSLNGNSSTTETATTKIADAPLTAGTVTLSAGGVEGVTPTTLSATFNDANTGAPNTDFSGTIDWGDGTLTQFMSSAVTAGGGGNFTVGGSHQYLEEGTYTTTVTINDDGGSLNGNSSTTETATTKIADAPLAGSGVTANGTQDVPLTGPVATFTDANPNGSVSDFTATVTWGDGTPTSSGTITESGGVFTVTGTHTYTIQGTYMPTVTIVDDGGSTATVTDTFDIVHTPPTVTAAGTATYIGAAAVTLDAGVTVSDPDSGGDLAGAAVTIGTGFIAGDTLEIGGQTSGTITDSGGTITYAFTGTTLTLSGPDTLADYQAALDAVTYSFTPSNGDATKGGTDTTRAVSWTVNDGAPINGTSTAASTLLVPATPVVTAVAASVNASASESFTPAQLFSASDAAGEPILTYEVKDETTGANQGFWVLNGAVLTNGQITTLTAAQLSALSFVAGSASTPVSDTLEVAASDAAGLGAFTTFTVTAAAHAPTTAPTVTAANELQAPNLSLAGSSLFSGTAFGNNTITSYEVEDTTTNSGHWMFNGVVEPTNQVIDVTVAQLSQLSFDTGYGSDTLIVRANDGTQWGSVTSFTVTPPPNAAPPAATASTLIMERQADGALELYNIGRSAIQLDGPLGQINPSLQVAGVGGFDGSDTADLLMRDPTIGAFTLYDVSNNNITGNVALGQVGTEWQVAGFGDFSGNASETDMLMRNSNTGAFEEYDIANNAITHSAGMGQVGLEWSIAGFGDFSTRANETDMLMRNSNTGSFEVYDIANNTITSAAPMGQVGLEWQVAGFGDFSGRAGEADMLMRNSNTGAFEVYDISHSAITSSAAMGQVGLEWQIAGFGDFSGSANETDMLMRNSNTGAFELYDISNNTITLATGMGQVGLEWSVAGISTGGTSSAPRAQLSGIAVDPAGTTPSSATNQLTQAMASFAPSAGTAATASLAQAPEASNTTSLLAATNHPQPIS